MKKPDLIEELEELDRFLDGESDGVVPIELLRERGTMLRSPAEVTPDEVHDELWKAIHAMAAIGMFVESTDHLSDAQLYEFVWAQLHEATMLFPDNPASAWNVSPIGGCSEEDNEIYLRYYADEETRRRWRDDFGDDLPEAQPRPFDRDRLLPTQGARMAELEDVQ